MSSGPYGFDQTVDDVDVLEERLEELDRGTRVRLTWRSGRSAGNVSATGYVSTSSEYRNKLLFMRTRERKGNIFAVRVGEWEITVRSTTSGGSRTIGWLVDVEEGV